MRKTWVKAIMAVFCVLLLNVGVWGCVLFGLWESSIPNRENFYETVFCWRVNEERLSLTEEGFLLWKESGEGGLSSYDQLRLAQLREELAAESTNFRFAVYDAEDGQLLFHNAGDASTWENEVYDTYTRTIPVWAFVSAGKPWWEEYTVEFGVLYPLSVEDEYQSNEVLMQTLERFMPVILGAGIACLVVSVTLLILLMRMAGRRPEREDVVLNLHDKIPYDLYLAVQVVLNAVCWGFALVEGIYYLSWARDLAGVFWVAGAGLAGSILVIAFLLTTVTRIKARTIFRNTVIWRLCKLIWKLLKKLWTAAKRGGRALNRAVHTLPMVWRIAVLFLIYLAGALLTAVLLIEGIIWFDYENWAVLLTLLMIIAVPGWHGFALYLLCRWALQWKRMRAATQEIISGKVDVKIEHEKFYPDLKEHAQQLNALGSSIEGAVNERMKSERFKSELITNVSHDLKTPLTSIISYVDLLKKEDIDNPTAREYIEVLDRKSQRLKKLTEDLVEASKASTGALTVNKERLDLVQLIRQALGEYEEKLSNAGLTLVTALPEQGVYINADGRHVWRVLDNLLGNCAKYALKGTRVYLDVSAWEEKAVITVKNVSREPLNIPAEQLMERFVRGDESRTTEGSGLGLSIARSLVELQGGQFSLEIDGDLFKTKVLLPLA